MPEFDYYMAISALKHAMLAIRDYSNGKTLGAPEALPNFAMEHLALYIDRHKSRVPRSEEHTSELQSLMRISYAVFCLKKKTNNAMPPPGPRSHKCRKRRQRR